MILEAVGGGRGPEAKALAALAKVSSTGESADVRAVQTQRRISLVLHRENARAVVRRLSHRPAMPPNAAISMSATLAAAAA